MCFCCGTCGLGVWRLARSGLTAHCAIEKRRRKFEIEIFPLNRFSLVDFVCTLKKVLMLYLNVNSSANRFWCCILEIGNYSGVEWNSLYIEIIIFWSQFIQVMKNKIKGIVNKWSLNIIKQKTLCESASFALNQGSFRGAVVNAKHRISRKPLFISAIHSRKIVWPS